MRRLSDALLFRVVQDFLGKRLSRKDRLNPPYFRVSFRGLGLIADVMVEDLRGVGPLRPSFGQDLYAFLQASSPFLPRRGFPGFFRVPADGGKNTVLPRFTFAVTFSSSPNVSFSN